MSKVISLDSYISKRKTKKASFSPYLLTKPIWFHEINDSIKALAIKDQDIIFRNVRYNYYPKYIDFIQTNQLCVSSYSFDDFLKDHIYTEKPFQIIHGIEFFSSFDMPHISKNDWKNIADITVRVSLSFSFNEMCKLIDPISIAHQYEWENIKINYDQNYQY